jgi:hypothetical protein
MSLWGQWYSAVVAGSYGVGVWNYIRGARDLISKFIQYEIKDGSILA